MTDLSVHWKVVPFGSLAAFKNGVNYSKANFGKGIKIINVKDFQDYSLAKFDNLDEINPEGIVREKDLLQERDILFVRSNGNRDLIGRTLYVAEVSQRITHSAFTIRARLTAEGTLPRFYAHLLRSDAIRQSLSAFGGGTNISNLNQQILYQLSVPFPPIQIQSKIVAILSAYDDLIENNLRRIQILEELAQNIYHEWFGKFRFPGHENVKMGDSALGMIPEGWIITPIGEKFTAILGGTPSRTKSEYWINGTIPWINSSKVNELRIITPTELITEEALNHSSTKLMPKRTTVIAITGATLGQVSLLEIEACANQSVVGIIDSSKIYSEYIYLKIKEIILGLTNKASGGAQQHINKDIVNNFCILLPPEQLVILFNEVCRPLFDLVTNNLHQNHYLRETRDLLLPKLISGEIDVSELDIKIRETG